jgi:hypothetical protein
MNKTLLALGILLLIAGASSAQVYVPQAVTAYYPPVYAAPAPYLAPVAYSTYYAPVVYARPRVAYMPVAPAYVAAPPVAVGIPDRRVDRSRAVGCMLC